MTVTAHDLLLSDLPIESDQVSAHRWTDGLGLIHSVLAACFRSRTEASWSHENPHSEGANCCLQPFVGSGSLVRCRYRHRHRVALSSTGRAGERIPSIKRVALILRVIAVSGYTHRTMHVCLTIRVSIRSEWPRVHQLYQASQRCSSPPRPRMRSGMESRCHQHGSLSVLRQAVNSIAPESSESLLSRENMQGMDIYIRSLKMS